LKFSQGGPDESHCTGSLIAPQWIFSAAHCIVSFVRDRKYDECVQRIGRYQRSRGCEWLPDGSLKINVVGFTAYLGVDDVNDKNDVARGTKLEMDYLVKHNQSYLAGGYGSYGGYDVALIHLKTPAPEKYTPACLPSLQYKDTGIGLFKPGTEKVNLAGYGRYFRRNCMTDGFGPSKQHYCDDLQCHSENAPRSPACNRFFAAKSESVLQGLTEVIVFDKSGRKNYCYRNRANSDIGSKNWCHVKRDISEINILRTDEKSWGFCSKDCFLQKEAPRASVLRKVKGVDILEEKYCDLYLDKSLQAEVEVRPKILCIGYVRPLQYEAWKETSNGSYRKISQRVKHKLGARTGMENFYITSAGTCNGDSGGPVFVKDDRTLKYVVLGAVSGGRGVLGDCGGMNNPTHYARLKYFGGWVKAVLRSDKEDVCFV